MAHRNGEIPLADLAMTSIGVRLRADAAASVERMAPRFRREVGHALLASDGYRAKAGAFGQVAIFEDRYPSLTSLGIADRRGPWTHTSHPTLGARWWYRRKGAAAAAVPGTSNHGWATACDFASGINTAGTPAHRWMNANGPEHGWIWPAWAQKQPTFEPWHREYHPDRDVHRVASDTATSTGLTPSRPIAPPTITLPEDFLMALTHDQQEEALRILRNLNAQVTGADGQSPSIASRVIAIEGQVTGLPDALAALPNSVWMAQVTGADPTTGQIQTHPAAAWVTVAAFRIAAGQSPAAVVQAIPAEIAREVADLLAQRLKG